MSMDQKSFDYDKLASAIAQINRREHQGHGSNYLFERHPHGHSNLQQADSASSSSVTETKNKWLPVLGFAIALLTQIIGFAVFINRIEYRLTQVEKDSDVIPIVLTKLQDIENNVSNLTKSVDKFEIATQDRYPKTEALNDKSRMLDVLKDVETELIKRIAQLESKDDYQAQLMSDLKTQLAVVKNNMDNKAN